MHDRFRIAHRSALIVAASAVALIAGACSGKNVGAGRAVGEQATVLTSTSTTSKPGPRAATVPAVFQSSVATIDAATAKRMTASWRPGCPVPLENLRLVTSTYWGFDAQPHRGELVVGEPYAEQVVSVLRELFDERFPIETMRLVDEFGGDDNRSMAANNTSAFNCRRATGSNRWSEHAYGRALDINPIQNPYITRSGAALPPAGAIHATRDPNTRGLITKDGPAVGAFSSIGWIWGGTWSSGKDYQHFSATGR